MTSPKWINGVGGVRHQPLCGQRVQDEDHGSGTVTKIMPNGNERIFVEFTSGMIGYFSHHALTLEEHTEQ